MGISWLELQAIPEYVVRDYLMVMEQELRAQREAERERRRS